MSTPQPRAQTTASLRRLAGLAAAVLAINGVLAFVAMGGASAARSDAPPPAATAQRDTRSAVAGQAAPRFVIHISVDGLGAHWYAPLLATGVLTHFQRLQSEGAWTHNARSDFDFTITLPNHTGMLTGRPVEDKYGQAGSGHHWTTNTTPPPGTTLHGNAGYYIASVFDVAHDNGLGTGLYASKEKFVLYDTSYDVGHGAADAIGTDYGPDKIDVFSNYDLDSTHTISDFLRNMAAAPTQYTFLHFNDADTAGHAKGWGSPEYNAAVETVNSKLGQILALIEQSDMLRGRTWIVLSADHGGTGLGHGDNTLAINYTIPLILWGPGIPANSDLYAFNGAGTTDPGASRPDTALSGQPIRNTDTGNCALHLLGLPAIPGTHADNLRRACGGAPTVYLPMTMRTR